MTSSLRDWAVRLVTGTPVEHVARRTWRGIYRHVPDVLLSTAERKGRDYDRQTVEIARRVLHRDANTVDAGAHLGELLREFIALAPEGRHIAVEPMPRFAEWLDRRFPEVRVERTALGSTAGSATFVLEADAAKSHLAAPDAVAVGGCTCITVPVTPLDDLVPADLPVDFVKIDVEGAERDVVLGATRTLARSGAVVVFECASDNLASVIDAFGRVSGRSYRVDLLGHYLAGGPPPEADDLIKRARRDGEYYYVAAPDRSLTDSRRGNATGPL